MKAQTKALLATSKNEKDVENAYRGEFNQNLPSVGITSPHGTDGYAQWGTVRALLEFKYDKNLKVRTDQCGVLGQMVLYLKKFEASGQPMPNVLFVGDKNECFALDTAAVQRFLSLPIDWKVAPSAGSPDLTQALIAGLDVSPFVFDVVDCDFRDVIAKIEMLAKGEVHRVRATLSNIAAMFAQWQDRIFLKTSGLTPVEQVDVFLRCLFKPDDVYSHPTNKNLLVVEGRRIPVNGHQWESFIGHFVRGYKPSEVEAFYAAKDRLMEDDARRRQGAFYTPTLWVDEAHKMVSEVLGPNWRDECVVWDCAAGTANLTRDYTFRDLILSTVEKPDVDVIRSQGYNPGAKLFAYDFLGGPSNVLPRLSGADRTDRTDTHPKGNRKGRKAFSKGSTGADLQDLILREDSGSGFLTPGPDPSPHPSLTHGVSEVLKVSPEEQVCGVDAGGIVTGVTDREILRDLPVMDKPREAVGQRPPAPVYSPVSVGVPATPPLPTFGGKPSRDPTPKPDFSGRMLDMPHVVKTVPKQSIRQGDDTSPFFPEKNVIPSDVDAMLKAAAKAGKRLVFFINPPYGTANNAGTEDGDHKAGIALTATNTEMKKAKIGASSQQLYAQFMYRAAKLAEEYGFAKSTVAAFSVPTFMCSGSYKGFRDFWFSRFQYQSGMLFQASHFADVSGRWGISFTVWSEGKTDSAVTLPITLKDVVDFNVMATGPKDIYNSDGRAASDWVREPVKGLKGVDAPQFSSGLVVTERTDVTIVLGAVGYFLTKGNGVMENGTGVTLTSSSYTNGHGYSVMPGESFRRSMALYAARKLVAEDWQNQKDEYLRPTDTGSDAYRQWNDDAIVYALLHNANNCTAMRDVQYKSKMWRIRNSFFPYTREQARVLYDRPECGTLYQDIRGDSTDPYLAEILPTLNLSPEAKECLRILDALFVASLPGRESFATSRPELHLLAWDAGLYQLKNFWREVDPNGWKALQVAFKALSDRLQPGVMDHGFLLK